jgi:hypothetical protein
LQLKERAMTITTAGLIRWSGLSAMIAGLIFVGIQPIHPSDELASVTTSAWAVITPLKTVMCLLFLLGLGGLYARQAAASGWLGLIGHLLFSLCWTLELAFIFAEAFIMPPLAASSPTFVVGFFGIFNGHPTTMNLGALPALWSVLSLAYILGSLLLGIATFRAGVLPRWAGALLTIAAALTPLAALIPHPLNRFVAVPMGLALAAIGYALWSEKREPAPASTVPGAGLPQPHSA